MKKNSLYSPSNIFTVDSLSLKSLSCGMVNVVKNLSLETLLTLKLKHIFSKDHVLQFSNLSRFNAMKNILSKYERFLKRY